MTTTTHPRRGNLHRALNPDDVLFESPIAPRPARVVISVVTGGAFVAATTFLEWGLRDGRHMHRAALAGALVGLGVALVMLWSAFTSKIVRRVVIDRARGAVALHRDSGDPLEIPLISITSVASEPAPGGYSRDPSERLVVTLTDGSTLRFELPDEADTPAIADDLRALVRPLAPG